MYSQFFCEYLEIKAETKENAKGKSWSTRGPLSPLKVFAFKMGTPCIGIIKLVNTFIICFENVKNLRFFATFLYSRNK